MRTSKKIITGLYILCPIAIVLFLGIVWYFIFKYDRNNYISDWINSLVALGTIGAVITSIYLTNRKPKKENLLLVNEIRVKFNKKTISFTASFSVDNKSVTYSISINALVFIIANTIFEYPTKVENRILSPIETKQYIIDSPLQEDEKNNRDFFEPLFKAMMEDNLENTFLYTSIGIIKINPKIIIVGSIYRAIQ